MGLGEYYNLLRLWRWLKGGCKGMDTSKMKSRKLWMTIILSVAVTVLAFSGVDPDIVKTIAALGITYLGAQAAVDVMKTRNGG